MCSIIDFLNFLNKIYNTYRDLHTRIILNNVLKLLLIMQHITIDEIAFCHTHKQFNLSHVTAADSDRSDSSRLYPNERYASIKFNTHKMFAQRA